MTAPLLDELAGAVGAAHVLGGEAIAERHRAGWFRARPAEPLAVVRPGTPDEVARVMAICHRHGQRVTLQGGMTGLVGGGTPAAGDLVVSLERLAGVEEIDADAATMTVLAGTPLQAAQEAARAAGLLLAVDLGSRGSCQVGGNIATNAGGNRVIRYGMMREQVLGLEVVLADGTRVASLDKMLKNNAGYDLKHLFIGSEGTLGVVTRAVLRLHPLPASCATAWCKVADYASAVALLRHAQAQLGGALSAFEAMWPDFVELMNRRVPAAASPLPAGDGAIHVLLEAEGSDPARDAQTFAAMLEAAFERGWLQDASVAQSLREREAFWRVRDAVSEFPRVWAPYCSYDVSLPIGRIGEFVQRLQASLRERFAGIEHAHFGHVGDSNLHVCVHLPGSAEAFAGIEHAIDAAVYGLLREYRGSVSAEHGIGTHKRAWLAHSRSPEELALMARVKQALDPQGLLNPGKVLAPAPGRPGPQSLK